MRTYSKDTVARTGPKPKSKQQRQLELDKEFGKGAFKLIDYKGLNAPSKFKHKCGKTFIKLFKNVISADAKCPCQHRRLHYADKRTAKSYQAEITKQFGNSFKVIKFNGIGNTVNTYRHNVCGKTFERSFNSFRLTKHCPNCSGNFGQELNRITQKEFEKRLRNKFGKDEYTVADKWGGISVPVNFEHKCGYAFNKQPGEVLRWQNPVCPDCVLGNRIAGFKVVTINGKEFKVQGFEPVALKALVKKYGVENVVTGTKNVRRFQYRFKGKNSDYYPDFIIKKKKLAVEVKSIATLGLVHHTNAFFGEDVYERNCKKAKAVIGAGYKFQMRLYNSSRKRIKLPDNWYELPKTALAKELNIKV